MRCLKLILIFVLISLFNISCVADPPIDKNAFEERWWELTKYSTCFYIDPQDKKVLLYSKEHGIYSGGNYSFKPPNLYFWQDEEWAIVAEGDCYKLSLNILYSGTICKCTLF